jgi:regulatory protein
MSPNHKEIKLKAMNLLARREHSQAELQRKLVAKGFAPNAVNAVMQELMRANLQSDARFTASYIRSRMHQGFGPLKIQYELRAKGIDSAINSNDAIWLQKAQEIWQKKFGNNTAKDLQSRAKQIRFMQYKGFTSEQIKYVLKPHPQPLS